MPFNEEKTLERRMSFEMCCQSKMTFNLVKLKSFWQQYVDAIQIGTYEIDYLRFACSHLPPTVLYTFLTLRSICSPICLSQIAILYSREKAGIGFNFIFRVALKCPKGWNTQIQFIKSNGKIICKYTQIHYSNRTLILSKQQWIRTLLALWPAFEIKYSVVIYVVYCFPLAIRFTVWNGFCVWFRIASTTNR